MAAPFLPSAVRSRAPAPKGRWIVAMVSRSAADPQLAERRPAADKASSALEDAMRIDVSGDHRRAASLKVPQ